MPDTVRPSYLGPALPRVSAPVPGVITPIAPLTPPVAAQLQAPTPPVPPAVKWEIEEYNAGRRLGPEISGFFEQVCPRGTSPMTLQLCMAGRAVVGWFSPPPIATPFGRPFDLQSWPKSGNAPPIRAGAFIVDTHSESPAGSPMWWYSQKGDSIDPNTTDPHLLLALLAEPSEASHFGTFSVTDHTRPEARISLYFDPKAANPDSFVRYRPGARLPWTVINGVTDAKARDLFIVEQVQPIAPRWIQELIDQLIGPSAGRLLENWHALPLTPPSLRIAARGLIAANIALPELEPGKLPAIHQGALLMRLTAALKDSSYSPLNGVTHRFWDWYSLVAAEEVKSGSAQMNSFKRLGVVLANQGFAYIISYLKAKAEFKLFLKGSVAGFCLRVRQVPVTYALDSDGARKINPDGVPEITDPTVLEDETKGTKFGGYGDLLLGAFADVGVGLGLSLDSGLSKASGGPSASKKVLGGDILSEVTCYSDANLTSADFDGVWFSIAAVKGPSAKVGNFVSVDVFSSILYQFWLKDTLLSAIVTKKLDPKPPSVPKFDLLFGGIKGIKTYIEGWTKGKASINLFEVSEGFGYVTHVGSRPAPSPTAARTPDYSAVKGASQGCVLFDVDKAVFQVGADILQDGHLLLDISLATMRGLITGGPGLRITIDGYTSPENPVSYNQGLSDARAASVRNGILSAFGNAMDPALLIPTGRGEGPSRTGTGLKDPPDDAAGRKAFKIANPDQVAKWAEWRKAEIAVEGIVVVVGKTAASP
jgi:flagellar motor protein MotB